MNTHKIFILTLIIFLLASCSRQEPLYQSEPLYVFGTLVGISIWGLPSTQAQQAVQIIAQDFQTMHQNWHAWHPSPVTDLNRAIAAGQIYTVKEPSLMTLLTLSKSWSHQSHGLFNPAIGQLINLWGFHNDELPVGPPPAEAAIASLVKLAPSLEDLEIKDHQVSSQNRSVQLDFGAIAKGYAVDLAIEKLKKLGIKNAIVNAGGNLKAIGKKGERPWWIGIRHPRGEGVLAALAISGEESVMTSGSYERYREYAGQRYSHIIDPRTGRPAKGLVSVTVINPQGALADAASTALLVAGIEEWYGVAKGLGIKDVMLVEENGSVTMSPSLAKRIEFPPDKVPKILISQSLSEP